VQAAQLVSRHGAAFSSSSSPPFPGNPSANAMLGITSDTASKNMPQYIRNE